MALLLLLAAGCARSDAGPRLLLTSTWTDEVIALDPADGRILERIAVDPHPGVEDLPSGTAVTADGDRWVAVTGGDAPELRLFRRGSRRPRATIPLGLRAAGRPGIDPAGERVVVPEYWLGDPALGGGAVVDLVDGALTPLPPLCAAPHQAAFSPDGRWLAVPCALDDQLLLLDGRTLELRHRVTLAAPAEAESAGAPHAQPMNVAWAPDSGRVWATLFREGAVAAVDTTGAVVARTPLPPGPADIAPTPDGRRLLISIRDDFLVVVLDAATLERTGQLVVAEAPNPHGVVVSPDGATAYITHEGTARSSGGVTAVRIADGATLWQTAAGAFTLDLRWQPGPRPPAPDPG